MVHSFKMKTLYESRNTIELIKKLSELGVPENEYKVYLDRFLEFKARRLGIPMHGRFELTPLCNLDCKMCYVHLGVSQFNKNNLLSVNTWKELISQAHEAGMINATLTGGECLTYPGFDEIYLYLYSKGIVPGILSNGILIDEQRMNFFKEYPPRRIQVSVYGSSEDAYELFTGKRVFSTVFRNLNLLKESKMPVSITITPSEYMAGDTRSILEKVEELGIPYNINANLIPPRKNTGRKVRDLSIDQYVDLFEYRSSISHEVLNPVDPSELPDESHEGNEQYGLTCGAGRSSFAIKYDGKMCPCLSLDETIADPLADGFSKAWKQINNLANTYPLPVECGKCVYYDRCLRCVAMHKNAPNPGHCDPRICERTKKLTIAGFIPIPQINRIE